MNSPLETPVPPSSSVGSGARRRFSWPKIFGYDFFISFKLGKPPDGAQSYASDLARGLRELDYAVFFSEEEAAPGAQLDATLARALRRSRILVVIANRGALLKSHWVRKEVEEFRAKHPQRPVVPINVDHAIETDGPQVDAKAWLGYEGRIWLDDTEQSVRDGIVSKELLQRLALGPRFFRANLLFRWLVTMVIISLIALAGFAWFKRKESHDRLVAYNTSQGRVALANGRALESAPSLLRALKEGGATPDLRFMLARAFASVDALVSTFDGSAPVFSPDGDRFAMVLVDGSVNVWSVPDMKVVTTLQGRVANARALTFAADGKMLVVTAAANPDVGDAGDEENADCTLGARSARVVVTLWDARSGSLLHELHPQGNRDGCSNAFFAGDGKALVVAGWSTQRTDLYWWATTFDPVTYAAVATTASGSKDTCRQLPPAAAEKEGEAECMGKVVAIAADGALLAVAPWDMPQRFVTLRNVLSGAEQVLSLGRDTEVIGASFSLDNQRIALTLPDGIDLWDVAARRKILSIPSDTARVAAEFSPDGTRIAAVSAERGVAVFDAASGQRLALLSGHAARIRVVTFSADSTRVLTAGDDALIKIWDSWTGRLLATLEGHRNPVVYATFSADDRFIVSQDRGGNVRLWNSQPTASTQTLREDPARIRWWSDSTFELVDWSPDGEKVLLKHRDQWSRSEGDGVFSLWGTRTGELAGLWRTAEPPALQPGGKQKEPSARDATVPSPCPADADEHESTEPLALDDRGGRVLSLDRTSASRVALVRSKADGCRPIRLEGHNSAIKVAAFSADGNLVLTADEGGAVMVWNTTTGYLLSVLSGERGPRYAAFLPGGRALTLNERNTAVVWDVSSEQRSIEELERLLACSRSVPSDVLDDLLPEGNLECSAAHTQEPATSVAANAFLASGWARRHDRSWAEPRLLAASALFQKSGDVFGEALSVLALRAISRTAGDGLGAEVKAGVIRELVLRLGRAKDQRERLTRLAEISFNEFGDTEMSRFVFARILENAPGDPIATLGSWETSLLVNRAQVAADGWSASLRALILRWVDRAVSDGNTREAAINAWNMYEGTTIDPIFERLDFRGLRREITGAKVSAKAQAQILAVLEKVELPGNHGNELKALLAVPEDTQVVGP